MSAVQTGMFGNVKHDVEHTKLAEKILAKYPHTADDQELFIWECAREIEPKLSYLDADVKASLKAIFGMVGSLRRRRNELVDEKGLKSKPVRPREDFAW
jgi:hypothetical protein